MSGADPRWDQVDAYYEGLLTPADPVLEQALADAERAGLPPISVSPLQGRLLEVLARAVKARRILEVGTLAGYSAICLGRALPADGRLVTLELEERHAAVARANLARAGLEGRVDVRVGEAGRSLQALVDEAAEPFDLVFIDADKNGYPTYLERALELTRPGSLIIADNVVRGGEVLNPNSRVQYVSGVRKFNERVAREPRLAASAVQTVGAKGYDGFAIAVVL